MRRICLLTILIVICFLTLPVAATEPVLLATTTSVENSGLLDALLPEFTKETGWQVKVVAVGSGKALRMGQDGEADALLVHDLQAEKQAVADGWALERHDLMENDFVIVGEFTDPAGLQAGAGHDVKAALKRISAGKHRFVSRGDDSGTHSKENVIWKACSIKPEGDWYISTGRGMGDTLRTADEKQAYCLTDRGTLLALADHLQLAVLCEGDPLLINPYGFLLLNPEVHKDLNNEGARALLNWLLLPSTATRIATFGKEKYGRSLFIPKTPLPKEEKTGGPDSQ